MIYDVAIVGAGMAGASLAATLDPRLTVLILEAEDHPGYHATGRSAAFWEECYGGPLIQPLTSASGPMLARPDADFADQSFLTPRGSLYIGRASDTEALKAFRHEFAAQGVALDWCDRAALEVRIEGLDPAWTCGVFGRDCSDIDVARLHQSYLRRARARGAQLQMRARVNSLNFLAGQWRIEAGSEEHSARLLVNAAGAWADDLAGLADIAPLGHVPYRRTIAQVRTVPSMPESLPLVIDFGGKFYFKPETGGRLWLSPHDESPTKASDVAAEELDVALALHRLAGVVDWQVEAVERRWAGLRTFAPDRLPIYGRDPGNPAFFWCTGQGGFGIQTAPAAALLCAALIEERTPDPAIQAIDPTPYRPERFSKL